MHDLAFADAARPTPVVVLKLPLRDYSLGHELLLLQRRNTLLLLSPDDFSQLAFVQQVFAIRQAVWTCCNTWAENKRQRFTILKLRIWDWHIRKTTPEDYALAIADFRNYLIAGRSLPPMPDPLSAAMAAGESAPESGGRALGQPLLASLLLANPDKYDMPFGYAAWLYFSALESEGRIKIENQKEREMMLELEQAKAEALAEEKQKQESGLATKPPDLGTEEN